MSARHHTRGAILHAGTRSILGFALAAFTLASSAVGLGAGDCASATRDLTQAQQALSKALRDADTRGEAYGSCMAKSGACASQKTAYDAACAARKKASAALKAATSERNAICTPE